MFWSIMLYNRREIVLNISNDVTYNRLQAFPLRQNYWDSDWLCVQKACPYLTDWGLRLLSCGLKRSTTKVVLVEPHYTCRDHRNLFSNYYSKKFLETSCYTNRLHFFSVEDVEPAHLMMDPESYLTHYIGYSVIRPVKNRCIGRTIIDPAKTFVQSETLLCLRTPFHAHINGHKFTVCGYPYTSQTTDVTVCAHSALWGVCRYLSQRYNSYREVYPFDLVMLTEPSHGRSYPYRGMTYTDYSGILTAFGSFPILLRNKGIDSEDGLDTRTFRDIYTYVESGFPVLASYTGHVVTLVGHTMDYEQDLCPDSNGFLDSSQFLKQFVVVDDNLFPYQLLGYSNDPQNYGELYPKKYSIDSIVTAVCPLPEKVFLPADEARKILMKYLIRYRSKMAYSYDCPIVTRLFLTTNTAFKRRKIQTCTQDSVVDQLATLVPELRLPHFIWVMEAGSLDDYKAGKCSVEIVIDPTAGLADGGVIYMRIKNTIVLQEKQSIVAGATDTFPQYTHNLGEMP